MWREMRLPNGQIAAAWWRPSLSSSAPTTPAPGRGGAQCWGTVAKWGASFCQMARWCSTQRCSGTTRGWNSRTTPLSCFGWTCLATCLWQRPSAGEKKSCGHSCGFCGGEVRIQCQLLPAPSPSVIPAQLVMLTPVISRRPVFVWRPAGSGGPPPSTYFCVYPSTPPSAAPAHKLTWKVLHNVQEMRAVQDSRHRTQPI